MCIKLISFIGFLNVCHRRFGEFHSFRFKCQTTGVYNDCTNECSKLFENNMDVTKRI